MAVSMGNAIRYLKYEIGKNLELPDEDVSFRVFFCSYELRIEKNRKHADYFGFSSLFCLKR